MSEKTALGTLTKHVDMKVNVAKEYKDDSGLGNMQLIYSKTTTCSTMVNLHSTMKTYSWLFSSGMKKKVSKTLDPERINNMILKSKASQQ